MFKRYHSKHITLITLFLLTLSGCKSTDEKPGREKYQVSHSYLKNQGGEGVVNEAPEGVDSIQLRKSSFDLLKAIEQKNELTIDRFSAAVPKMDDKSVTMAANDLPMEQFLHYAFGEILGINYVLSPELKGDKNKVTLNVQNALTKLELLKLISAVLTPMQVSIDFNENTFFIQKSTMAKAKAQIGIGRTPSSVPQSNEQILQVVPVKYGIKISLEKTLLQLTDASITPDFQQNALFILGKRQDILRALELVGLLDVPSNRGKYIGLLSLEYISSELFVQEAIQLLENEGIPSGSSTDKSKVVYFVPLSHIGAIAIFTGEEEHLNRVRYWASILDQPSKGENAQYFIYNPEYARAADLGASISGLLSLRSGVRPPSSPSASASSTGGNADALRQESVNSNILNGNDVSFVVDERSNSLIFSTTGTHYLKLLPLLKRLDTLPKQIILDVMIAEVSLTDDFKYGVEFALKNSDRFNISTLGAFNANGTGGIASEFQDLDFIGTTEAQLAASFFRGNTAVNIVSNPSLLVRDGTSATINVGTRFPIETAVASEGVTSTNISYQQTGVNLTVTPTVNAQGIVIMSINQSISNALNAETSARAPTIFERSLKTEAVVESGNTVILAGLISENTTNGESSVPFLGDLPLIGNVFKGENNSSTKTELVMIVTPKVIESSEHWDKIISDFENGLQNIKIEK